MGSLKVLVEKEWWTLRDNPYQLFSYFALVVFITVVSLLVPPTPQSSYVAYRQITSNPELFGVSKEIISSLGSWVVNFGIMVTQEPVVFGMIVYISVYSYLTNAIVSEKTNKTIEVLFSTPLDESEIVASKMMMGAGIGIGLAIFALLVHTLGIEVGFYHHTGTWWRPTTSYLLLMVVFSLAFSTLAFPVALIVGMKGSKILTASGTFVVFIPIGVLLIASKLSATEYIRIMATIAIASAVLAIVLAMFSKRLMNRLAFITN